MPWSEVRSYCDLGARAPVVVWLEALRRFDPDAFAKCAVAIRRLIAEGHELRRPIADFLVDGLHELRIRRGRINYRILYFFPERNVAVLLHGLKKEARSPVADLDRARARRDAYRADPTRYTHYEELE